MSVERQDGEIVVRVKFHINRNPLYLDALNEQQVFDGLERRITRAFSSPEGSVLVDHFPTSVTLLDGIELVKIDLDVSAPKT